MADTFKNRLLFAMQKNNIKATELSKKTGLSKAQISQYVNGVYEAKQQALYKLAVALNVSEAWLMGHDVPMERESNPSPISDTQLKFALFNGQNGITDEMLEEVKQFAEFVMNKKS